jgi:hypothetical protein
LHTSRLPSCHTSTALEQHKAFADPILINITGKAWKMAYYYRSPCFYRAGFLLYFLCGWFTRPVWAAGQNGSAIYVKSGESIQAAIDAAHLGQLVWVGPGAYAEQLTISTDGLQLVATGAVLVPPKSAVRNTCSGLAGPGTEAGICVTGQDVQLADFVLDHRQVLSVGQPVKNVIVTGFQVQGPFGLDIAVVGGQGVQIEANSLSDGTQYGCLTVGSNNTHIDGNNVASTLGLLYIGICVSAPRLEVIYRLVLLHG